MREKFVFGSYGTYAFRNKKRPLVWQKEESADGKIVVTLTEMLEERPYDLDARENDWKESELRNWLHTDFIKEAFSIKEQEAICPRKLASWREYYAGDTDYSTDLLSIPDAAHFCGTKNSCEFSGLQKSTACCSHFRPKKSLCNQLLEGEFQGCWLRNGIKVTRSAYVDKEGNVNLKTGLCPDQKLSVMPVLCLDPEKLPRQNQTDFLTRMENGILLDESCFYSNGAYVKAYVDQKKEFVYVLTEQNEAVIVGRFQEEKSQEEKSKEEKHQEESISEEMTERERAGKEIPRNETLVFPARLDGYAVAAILGEYGNSTVKKIVVEEGIRTIGEECFVLCEALEEAVLPDTLKELDSSNFTACPKLSKIHLSKTHPYYCLEENVLYTKDKKKLVKCLPDFENLYFMLPEGVEEIAPGAFSETEGMLEISLPKSVKSLGAYAFAYAGVDVVYLNSEMTSIEDRAFFGSKIKRIEIPDRVPFLGDGIFEECRNLQKIVLPKRVEAFGKRMFYGCSILKSVCLPEGVKELKETFTNCMLLKQVYLPESLEKIDEKSFDLKEYKITDLHYGEVFDPAEELVLYGEPDSEAERYAKKHHRAFSREFFDEKRYEKENIYRSSVEQLKEAQKSDVITFGSYIQRADGSRKDPVEWLVLKREGSRLLVITKEALDDREYDIMMSGSSVKENQTVLWENCELKGWLNGPCRNELFTKRERECASELFLLTFEEVENYLPVLADRICYRTEYNYVRYGLKKKAQWWLKSITEDPDYGSVYQDTIYEDGELSCCSSNMIQSVRPAVWIDIKKAEKYLYPDNETYIKNWFLAHNEYMDKREEKEEYLDLLVFYTVLFEILAGINEEDVIVVEDEKVRVVSGPAVTGEQAEWILKNVNFAFAYVGIEEAKLHDGWRYAKYLSGILTKQEMISNYEDWYEKTMRSYGAAYLERDVYVIKGKAFYADQPLTDEEIEYIRMHEKGEQTQYSVDHGKHGIMWW